MKSRIKTPFKSPNKSVSPKRPSAAEPSQRPVSVSPENRSVDEESKSPNLIKLSQVAEVAQDDGSDYESPSPGNRTKRKKNNMPSFSPDNYRFKKNDYNVAQDMYKESFYEHKEVNKSKIN